MSLELREAVRLVNLEEDLQSVTAVTVAKSSAFNTSTIAAALFTLFPSLSPRESFTVSIAVTKPTKTAAPNGGDLDRGSGTDGGRAVGGAAGGDGGGAGGGDGGQMEAELEAELLVNMDWRVRRRLKWRWREEKSER